MRFDIFLPNIVDNVNQRTFYDILHMCVFFFILLIDLSRVIRLI